MNDFLHWLYASYIKPQLDEADCEIPLDMEFLQDADLEALCGRVSEFYASRAFLLGLRAGADLRGTSGN